MSSMVVEQSYLDRDDHDVHDSDDDAAMCSFCSLRSFLIFSLSLFLRLWWVGETVSFVRDIASYLFLLSVREL